MRNRRVFFYNDSRVAGGHEILTARILNTLVDRHDITVHFAYYCDDLTQYLSAKVTTSRLPFNDKSTNLYRLLSRDISLVKQIVLEFNPDIAIIAQGFIESGVRGLAACRLAGVTTGSYIPFGNNNRELGNRFALLRDIISILIFRLSQFYITISAYQSRSLQRFISGQPIYIINNPVAQQPTRPKPPVIPKGNPSLQLNIAVVGRVLFKQKNQDILVPVAESLAAACFKVHFHIIGEGPDRATLESLVEAAGCRSQFSFHNWMHKAQLEQFIELNIDLVLIPSHYEGLPLVFLEAIYLGKPILISRMPFLCDYPIPECYLIDADSVDSIVTKIQQIATVDTVGHLQKLQEFVESTNSFARFNQDIDDCFQSLLGAPDIPE